MAEAETAPLPPKEGAAKTKSGGGVQHSSRWMQLIAQNAWFATTLAHLVLSYAYYIVAIAHSVTSSNVEKSGQVVGGWAMTTSRLYRYAMLASVASYAIVLYSSFGIPRPNEVYLRKILFSDNFYYFLLACWYAYSAIPFFFLLLPFSTYATFHLTNTISRFLLPKIGHEGLRAHVQSILRVLDRNQTWILSQMPYYEIAAGILLLILTLTGRGHFITFFIYYNWLRLRTRGSPAMQRTMTQMKSGVDRMIQSSRCPGFIRRAYQKMNAIAAQAQAKMAEGRQKTQEKVE